MELAFVEKSLRDLCASRTRLELHFGQERAEALRNRLADLRAASSIHELVLEPPYPIGDHGLMALPVLKRLRIVFCANYARVPINDSGKLDWAHIARIKIVDIDEPAETEGAA